MMTLAALQQLIPEQQIARYDAQQHRATLADGTVLAVWHYRQPRQAATVVAATQLCAAEDVAPRVWGADVAGQLCGTPCVVVTAPQGQLLATLAERLSHTQLHQLGQQLGQIVAHIHGIPVTHYGSLSGDDVAPDARTALWQRISQAGQQLEVAQIATASAIAAVCQQIMAVPMSTPPSPVLVCGDIDPESIWVTKSGSNYRISMLSSWSAARGSWPGSEHVRVLANFAAEQWFSLRVGYGEAYDEAAPLAYNHVRESAVLAERLGLLMSQAANAASRGDRNRASQHWNVLQRWCAQLQPETIFSDTKDASPHEQ
jgi:hypothetical protein